MQAKIVSNVQGIQQNEPKHKILKLEISEELETFSKENQN